MQKKLLAAAVLSTLSGVAAAQSANVTIYGNITQPFEFISISGGDGSSTIVGTVAGSVAQSQNNSIRVNGVTGGTPATNVGAARLNAAVGSAGVPDQATRTRFQNAGSNFGLRGTEDLGNGLSAWFQIELSMGPGTAPPNANGGTNNHGAVPTFRNSGVGLRSNTWGTLLTGAWDSVFNQLTITTNANGRIGSASTNFNANLLGATTFGTGAVSGQNLVSWCGAAPLNTPGQCFNYGTNFDRRDRSSVQWWSPNWNGFDVKVGYEATSDTGGATVNNRANGAPNFRPTQWEIAGAYNNGPFSITYGYSRYKDVLALAAQTQAGFSGGEGNGIWTIGAGAAAGAQSISSSLGVGHRFGGKYTFNMGGGSAIGLGALWESLKWDMGYSANANAAAAAANNLTQLKKTAYRLQANFSTGNHFFSGEYTKANEIKGSIQQVAGGVAGSTGAFDGGGSAAKGYILGYNYMLSKRTSMGAYYTAVINDTNANYSGLVFGGVTPSAGGDVKYYGLMLKHSF